MNTQWVYLPDSNTYINMANVIAVEFSDVCAIVVQFLGKDSESNFAQRTQFNSASDIQSLRGYLDVHSGVW